MRCQPQQSPMRRAGRAFQNAALRFSPSSRDSISLNLRRTHHGARCVRLEITVANIVSITEGVKGGCQTFRVRSKSKVKLSCCSFPITSMWIERAPPHTRPLVVDAGARVPGFAFPLPAFAQSLGSAPRRRIASTARLVPPCEPLQRCV